MDVEALFRRRLKELIERRYGSLDRMFLETDFSKGHLSNMLRGNGSPTVTTLVKLARVLDVEVREFFVFPERSPRDRALELVEHSKAETLRRVTRLCSGETDEE